MACVSPKAYESVVNDLKKIDIAYGFKLNAFKKIPVGYTVASKDAWGNAGNPNTVLGRNTELNESTFYEYAKKFKENGATILGGCCEIRPSHIKEISRLK
jgi:homocysteine S-methyltransferase